MEKLFSLTEIELIQNHKFPLFEFWRFWSVKESAYKIWQRYANTKPVFNPMDFQITFNGISRFSVQKGHRQFRIKTESTSAYIYASNDHEMLYISKIFSSRERYLNYLEDLSLQGWGLTKNSHQIPKLIHSESHKACPISISHDGDWYAVQINKNYFS